MQAMQRGTYYSMDQLKYIRPNSQPTWERLQTMIEDKAKK